MFVEYCWIAVLAPLLAFVIVGAFGTRIRHGGGFITIAGAAIAFVMSLLTAYDFFTSPAYANPGYVTESLEWFKIGDFTMSVGYYIDSLSVLMMLFASFISTLIFTYSLGYMGDQGIRKRRYFAEVALFLTGMIGCVSASNMVQMFLFWEIMGLCSYLLIGFWGFGHPEAAQKASAAKKAFLVTRAGDVCLMAGMFVLFFAMGSLDYVVIFNGANLAAVDPLVLTLAALLIFGGAIGKSAQFPLLDWLPDAMAGPTTVSALIHAATMVKAGVYIVARCFPLFCSAESYAILFVGIIGGFTAFFAATMAMNNFNIKKVLAYSTLSQLGYMFLSLGAGGYLFILGIEEGSEELMAAGALGYSAAILHMVNHAFFKAGLFLGSGSVIHSTGTEDMRLMGGLGRKMPITSITMLVGCLSIAGFPFFAGFWSKDLVLDVTFEAFTEGGSSPEAFIFLALWILGVVTAFMTAFYMFRLWFMTFTGKCRENAEHCHGESPYCMSLPLVVLAIFAFGFGFTLFFGFDGVFSINYEAGMWQVGNLVGHTGFHYLEELLTNPYTYLTIVLVLVAIYLAYAMYCRKSMIPGKFNKDGESALYKVIANRWYFPQLYDQVSWKLGYGVAKAVEYTDRNIIDGSVNGLANAVIGGGDSVSKAQDGNVHTYSAVVIFGIVLLFVAAAALVLFYGVI